MTRAKPTKAIKDVTRSSAAYQQVVDSLAAAAVSRIDARISFIDPHAVRLGKSTGLIVFIGGARLKLPGYFGRKNRLLVNRRNYEIAGVSQAGEEVGRQGLRILDMIGGRALELHAADAVGPDVATIKKCLRKDCAADLRRLQAVIDAHLLDPATLIAAQTADQARRAAARARAIQAHIHQAGWLAQQLVHHVSRDEWLEMHDVATVKAVLHE